MKRGNGGYREYTHYGSQDRPRAQSTAWVVYGSLGRSRASLMIFLENCCQSAALPIQGKASDIRKSVLIVAVVLTAVLATVGKEREK